MGRRRNKDLVGDAVIEASKKSLPFRWWANVDFPENGQIYVTIRYHTGRGNKDSLKPYSDGGESCFTFSEREVANVIPADVRKCNFALCDAIGKAKWRIDQLNRGLRRKAQIIAASYGNDATRYDPAIIEAFSLAKADGTMKPPDDPFVSRLRIIALHEAVIAKLNRDYVGFNVPRF